MQLEWKKGIYGRCMADPHVGEIQWCSPVATSVFTVFCELSHTLGQPRAMSPQTVRDSQGPQVEFFPVTQFLYVKIQGIENGPLPVSQCMDQFGDLSTFWEISNREEEKWICAAKTGRPY